MIRLIDLIKLAGVELGNYKIHLATGAKDKPINAFYDGKFKEWQEGQRQRNFECERVIGMIHIGGDRWLFAGVWDVHGCVKKPDGFRYRTTEIGGLEHIAGRAVISFRRQFRASYLRGDNFGHHLVISEIRQERLSVENFPGYSSTRLPFDTLCVVVRQRPDAWVTALRCVAGVYLIADGSNGKLYVGSACGEGGIWNRWETYARNGHGGNKELVEVIKAKGIEHASHFVLSILEICALIATKDEVLARETHWKNVLMSREFGYNKN
ncbi:MAG: GIY-YIG nuclease family protein [Verrucomicrobia bacterium]|nr:GIY-YIG nuclease family protein [Verrucomicrobiota bacterium]